MIKQFHHRDLLPLDKMLQKKSKTSTSISIVIPAYNESATIGTIISTIKKGLVDKCSLIDEIIVMDGDSKDDTAKIARDAGASVYNVLEVGNRSVPPGKGSALWKSSYVATGDLIVCIDADIKNFDNRFVYGLIAPLLFDSSLFFIKGYYKRPLIVDDSTLNNYGGRVTEIMVRPFLSSFYPELAYFYQPLAGEYSFRRELFQRVGFLSGYGVEIGLIIDLYRLYGTQAFAQVDMDIRCHRNRDLNYLGKMSFGIFQAMLEKCKDDKKITLKTPLNDTMITHGSDKEWEETNIKETLLPPRNDI